MGDPAGYGIRNASQIRRTAMIAKILLGCAGVATLLALVADANSAAVVREVIEGVSYSESQLAELDEQLQASGQVQLFFSLVTAIAFIRWHFLSYRATAELTGAPMNHGLGWAVGAWFVPLLNFVRPFRMMKGVVEKLNGQRSTIRLMRWWWGLLIVSGVFARLGSSLMDSAQDAEGVLSGINQILMSDLLYIPAAILAILVVGRVTTLIVESTRTADVV